MTALPSSTLNMPAPCLFSRVSADDLTDDPLQVTSCLSLFSKLSSSLAFSSSIMMCLVWVSELFLLKVR